MAQEGVAPCVGAWIETRIGRAVDARQRASHPAWVRGLKHTPAGLAVAAGVSHPAWVRGLKPP